MSNAVKVPSAYQQAIENAVREAFTNIERGEDPFNLKVDATAGSGKTWLLEQSVKWLPPGKSVIILALNKSTADELKSRGLPGRTFHSLCYGPVMAFKKQKKVDFNKAYDVIDHVTGDSAPLYGRFLKRLVSLGMSTGIGCLVPDTAENWQDLVTRYDLELDSDHAEMRKALAFASDVLAARMTWRTVDFDDMMYLVVKHGLTLEKVDFIGLDEAQDTAAIQRAVIRMCMHDKSVLMAVGDKYQSIYAFRGADHTALDMIAAEFDCRSLPLSITYRCSKAVVKQAQRWCPTIEAAPDAIDGAATYLDTNFKVTDFRPDDLVVCRTSAPLIKLAYRCLRDGVAVKIVGKEIGQGLIALVKKMDARGIDGLQEKLTKYTQREVDKARALRDEAKMEARQVGLCFFPDRFLVRKRAHHSRPHRQN